MYVGGLPFSEDKGGGVDGEGEKKLGSGRGGKNVIGLGKINQIVIR